MRRTLTRVDSVLLSPSGKRAVRLSLPATAMPAPGQLMLACRPGGDDPLRQPLHPVALHPDGLTALVPQGTAWNPGEQLDVFGPIGRGFRPFPTRRRWLLAAFGVSADVLLPLLEMGRQRGVSLAMWADSSLPPLPPDVEVPAAPEPAVEWADYVGLAVTPEWLEVGGSASPIMSAARRLQLAEAMVVLPMPCGTGVCGACVIGGGRSAICACTDGPVVALEDLVR